MSKRTAGYITAPETGAGVPEKVARRRKLSVPFSKLASVFLLAVLAFPAFAAFMVGADSDAFSGTSVGETLVDDGNGNMVSASAFAGQDFPQWFMCDIAPELATPAVQAFRPDIFLALQESPRLYQWANTDDLPFYVQSKSAIVGAHNEVDNYLPNRILNLSTGPSFGEVNDWVVDSVDEYANDREDYEEYTGGVAVSPYDRFGLAGLQWSSYGGEWKYYQVDACAPGEEANDPGLNKFYEDRLEPRATFEGTGDSPDPRTQQFNIGWFNKVGYGIGNTVANHIFFVAKMVVSTTIALVSFAFGDVVTMLGVDNVLLGEGGDGSGGVFGMLYQSIFLPLIVVAFILTAMYMMWYGIVKRQYRQALVSGLLRSVICFLVAFVVLANPATVVSLPNNIAVFTQSIIFSAFTEGSAGGDGLCSTSIHEVTGMDAAPNMTRINPERSYSYMESVGASISSSLGCTMWQTLLLDPWAQGQFGDSVDELYAEGFAPRNAGTIGNSSNPNNNQDNGSWVGNADVALGNGEYINNWALFQMSTQTDSHYDVELEELNTVYTAGVNNDWWRIVDALSNYSERTFTNDLTDVGSTTGDASVQFPDSAVSDVSLDQIEGIEIIGNDATEYWNSWIGNNTSERFLMASTAVVFSIAASVPMLILALLTAVYAIGLSIIIAFAPIMLLFACWAGKGWSIFTDWAQLLLNTMLARIAIGVLMVLIMGITVAALDLLDSLGFFKALVAMVVLSWLVIKNKKKFMDQIAFVRFSAAEGGLSGISSRIGQTGMGLSKLASGVALSGVAGGVHGARRGSVFTGVKAGMSTSLKNDMYSSKFKSAPIVASTVFEFDNMKHKIRGHNEAAIHGVDADMQCARCGNRIDGVKVRFTRSKKTNLTYCIKCYDRNDFLGEDTRADVFEIAAGRAPVGVINDEEKVKIQRKNNLNMGPRIRGGRMNKKPAEIRRRIETFNESNGAAVEEDKELIELVSNTKLNLDPTKTQDQDFIVAFYGMEAAIFDLYKVRKEEVQAKEDFGDNLDRHSLNIPKLPEELEGRIDPQMMNELIAEGEWEILVDRIAEAWAQWYEEQGIESTEDENNLGYDEDRVSDLRVEMLNLSSKLSLIHI